MVDPLSCRPTAAVILAAGQGTRMKSTLPKVLHRLGSLSLVERVLRTVLPLQPLRCFVIVGHGQELVRQALSGYAVEFVEQREQRGTGHAVQQLIPCLEGFEGNLLVLNGDVPLLRPSTLTSLLTRHGRENPAVSLLTAQVADPTGYGRVFCTPDLKVLQIVEHKDCTPAQLQNNRINAGVYCFHWPHLVQILPLLQPNNRQQELYLTDAVTSQKEAVAVDVPDAQEIQGINDRVQLAEAFTVLQDRIKEQWMRSGVTLVDPASITIDDDVIIEPDVVIEPQTHLKGKTQIQTGCCIGPGSLIENSQIGPNCQVLLSVVNDSQIGEGTAIGPYAHIRQHSQIADHCRVGNFVELKKTSMGSGTNAAHLSYLGDGVLGEQVNIGAGTIFANYDGVQKHPTQLGSRSKTGANSTLVAPITVGEDVTIAAGSTLTTDVPNDCLVIARSPQVIKPGWRRSPRP